MFCCIRGEIYQRVNGDCRCLGYDHGFGRDLINSQIKIYRIKHCNVLNVFIPMTPYNYVKNMPIPYSSMECLYLCSNMRDMRSKS